MLTLEFELECLFVAGEQIDSMMSEREEERRCGGFLLAYCESVGTDDAHRLVGMEVADMDAFF